LDGDKRDGINIYDPKTDKINSMDAHGLLKGKDVYGIIEGETITYGLLPTMV
jgi:hypothetical protein